MKKIVTMFIVFIVLTACATQKEENNKIKVVSSYSIITDMLNQIGNGRLEVYNLVPSGTDPHEYEPLPEDIKKATDAELMFFNGLNLEGGENGWFNKLAVAVRKQEDQLIDLGKGIEPMYISDTVQHEETINPHAYLDPNNGITMVKNILNSLIEYDPEYADTYTTQANNYIDILTSIEQDYKDSFDSIDNVNKIIVTSERAFQYMNDRYNIKEGYIWDVDTEEIGTVTQIKTLTNFIKDNNVKVLFMESNVDRRPMQTVSQESGVPIFKTDVYSDEIGIVGSEVDTYEKLLTHNLETFLQALH